MKFHVFLYGEPSFQIVCVTKPEVGKGLMKWGRGLEEGGDREYVIEKQRETCQMMGVGGQLQEEGAWGRAEGKEKDKSKEY